MIATPNARDHDRGLPMGADVRRAAEIAGAALRPAADADWSVPAGDVTYSCRDTLAHIVESMIIYARDLATPVEEATGDHLGLRCDPEGTVTGLLDALHETAAVLAAVVDHVPTDQRGFHPDGQADASGFAAMACDEILVHTGDITAGLDLLYAPPSELCERVVRRLFPWAPEEGPAWQRLLWANGRTGLPERPRLDPDWIWHCAPLREWDGQDPTTAR